MGATPGHVNLGLAFMTIGLWHLFNTIKLHTLHPNSFSSHPWFPVSIPRLRATEPISIMLVTATFISFELFIRDKPFSPFHPIPPKTLPHLEHSLIALSFFVYALFSLLLRNRGLSLFLQALAFGIQLLIFNLHSTDHMGLEGHYHWLLQIVTLTSLITTLFTIGYSKSFINSFARAFSVVFQGVWLIVTGVMLWNPKLLPNDCFLKGEAVLCTGDEALDRAKALVNIQFAAYLISITTLSMTMYLVVEKYYSRERVEYSTLTKTEEELQEHITMRSTLKVNCT